MGLSAAGIEPGIADKPGGIFLRSGDQISNEDRVLFQTVARAIINDANGSLIDQVNRRPPLELVMPLLLANRSRRADAPGPSTATAANQLRFFNGLGGFSAEGHESIILTDANSRAP